MITAEQFVSVARAHGFDWYAGVPCSYLTPFINYVLQDPLLRYVSAANEGDAVAVIAGVALGGRNRRRGVTMLQNSGLGNAVSPLTSLTWTFRLPQLLIVTWRGQPGTKDEPQHALMGEITFAMLDTMHIPSEIFPTEPEAIEPAVARAIEHMDKTGLPYALVMEKGSVLPYALKPGTRPAPLRRGVPGSHVRGVESSALPSRREALQRVIAHTPLESTVVLASTGYCGRELYAIEDRPNQLYMVGSMGCVTALALGLALVRPDLRVIALDGDGAALMRMGVFATLGTYGPPNLIHILLDNGEHESTGGQATVSPNVSFAAVAAACGHASALETDDLEVLDEVLAASALDGPRFVRLSVRAGTSNNLPRPSMSPAEVKTRLMRHIDLPVEVQ